MVVQSQFVCNLGTYMYEFVDGKALGVLTDLAYAMIAATDGGKMMTMNTERGKNLERRVVLGARSGIGAPPARRRIRGGEGNARGGGEDRGISTTAQEGV